jgi:hypothetical protein
MNNTVSVNLINKAYISNCGEFYYYLSLECGLICIKKTKWHSGTTVYLYSNFLVTYNVIITIYLCMI